MGVDIVSTPAKNRDRPFGKRNVLRAYFSEGLQGADPVLIGRILEIPASDPSTAHGFRNRILL
jgi:hypothetical protein